MRTHSLSRPLTVEPPLSPPDPPPLMPCESCSYEDELDDELLCDGCAHLYASDSSDLAYLVIGLREELAQVRADRAALSREVARLLELCCPDCAGTGVLTDDESSPCHCPEGRR